MNMGILRIDLLMSKHIRYKAKVREWAEERLFQTVADFQPGRGWTSDYMISVLRSLPNV
jgi:hypothetical protein